MQGHAVRGYFEKMGGGFGPSTGVEVAPALPLNRHGRVRVPADHCFNPFLPRHAQGVVRYVLVEHPIKQRPFLGVLGYVGIAPTEPDAATVQVAESPFERRVSSISRSSR